MRAGARPAITLAAGQVWVAEDGTTRTVVELNPVERQPHQAPTCRCVVKGQRVTVLQTSLKAWILRTNAVLENVLADAG